VDNESHVPVGTAATAFSALLATWHPGSAEQAALRDDYMSFLALRGDTAAARDGGPEHLTASCFVFSPDLAHIVLCFHRKGQFWVQLGGHVEPGDESLAAAAMREAREESGLADLVARGGMADLDRHGLGDGFGRCSVHWDAGFAATADRDAVPVASDESEQVRWWPVDALPDTVPPGFASRVAGVLTALGAPRT
jgi:8-oxo-dGTP pyrophosphatase MutT (NUDIX family)